MKDLAVISLNYNGSDDTIECLKSLSESKTNCSYHVFVLDNDSAAAEKQALVSSLSTNKEYTILSLEDFSKLNDYSGNYLVLSSENLGFAKGNNKIIEKIYREYRYVLLLNNDTVVTQDFIQKMIDYMDHNPVVGFSSCKINYYYDPEDMWNCGGVLRPWGLRKYFTEKDLKGPENTIRAGFISGCALFIRSSVIEKHGLLTDQFFFGEEDFNFCWRMKKAHVVGMCLKDTLVYHKVSKSSEKKGGIVGKKAAYYVLRIVDMKQFYPHVVWVMWKDLLVLALGMKWRRDGIGKENVKRMKQTVLEYSKRDAIRKEDLFCIWEM